MAASPPEVFPRPRHLRVTGPVGSAVEATVTTDARLPPQGYVLDVGAAGTAVRHADEAGLRHARHALGQLRDAGPIPALEVRDHPDHLRRGYMLDVSRDRVPTRETLDWLVGVLAALRVNHLELYVEHTYAYEGHDLVWRDASPLTAADLHWLDDRCATAGIELVANQNTFGHMERWLRHDAHRWRAECPDAARNPFSGRSMPPTTLAPTADNADFAVALVREQAAQVRSRTVHVGADEPFELGQGASASAVAERGGATVYLEHLARIVQPLLDDGREVLFWGDILRRHPELVARLPGPDLTAVVWHYDAPSEDGGLIAHLGPDALDALGLPDDFFRGFAAHVRTFVETGFPHWVAPGTSTWNSLVGRWDNARANLLDAAVVGRDTGAEGCLVTDWGDNGHLQPLVVSLLPIAYGAAVAWCAEANAEIDVAPVVDRLAGTPGLGGLLAELGGLHRVPGVETANASPLFAALDPGRPSPLVGRGDPAGLTSVVEHLDAAVEDAAALGRVDLLAAVRLARHGGWRLAARGGVATPDPATVAADLDEIRHLHEEAWLATSRPGGLADSLRHLPEVPR